MLDSPTRARVLSPTSGPQAQGSGQISPEQLFLKPVGLNCRSPTSLGQTETPFLKAHTKLHVHRAKEVVKSLGQTYLLVLESTGEEGSGCGSRWGQRHEWQPYPGALGSLNMVDGGS